MSVPFNPLVSIVIPVYNGSNYLRDSINSALAQTYQNIEILVINDGSTDGGATEAIALEYGDRIRYFSKPNGGCGSALNFGIRHLRGEYFSWLSHDDRYLPNKIGRQVDCLSRLSNKNTLIYGGYQLINAAGVVTHDVPLETNFTESQLTTPLFAVLEGMAYGCTFLIPTTCFYEIGFFDEALPTTQDYALWYDFFRSVPLYVDFEINTQYRLHDAQDTKIHTGHVEECNDLWIGFLNKTTPQEKVNLYGSEYGFYQKLASFLRETPYTRALNYAESELVNSLQNIKVSVVIPFFNDTALLLSALESVEHQTHQNYEIVLVDDGSTQSLADLQTFISRRNNILYFRQDNQGPACARNLGVSKSTGRYVAFLDADDLFYPTKLQIQLEFMEKNQLSFSHTNYIKLSPEGKKLEKEIVQENFIGTYYPQILESCLIATPTVMAKRELLLANPFMTNLRSGEDVCLWIALAHQVQFGYVGKPLSAVRISFGSHAYDPVKLATGCLNIAQYLLADPNHAVHKEQIANLIKDASVALSEDGDSSAIFLRRKAKNSASFLGNALNLYFLKKIRKKLNFKSIALAWDRLKHRKNLTVEKIKRSNEKIRLFVRSKHVTMADVEGFLVRLLKPLIPIVLWNACTSGYRKIKKR